MLNSMLIRGGRVIDPANGIDKVADILVENGKVADIKNAFDEMEKTPPKETGETCPDCGLVLVYEMWEEQEDSCTTIRYRNYQVLPYF